LKDNPKVAIVAGCDSKFSKNTEKSIFDIAMEPCVSLFKNKKNGKINKDNLDAVIFSSCTEEQYTSSILSEMIGIKPKISQRLDNLCNSGSNAIINAYSYIVSGLCESVLVVGAEKTTTSGKRLAWDISRGNFSSPIYWASLFARMHMRKFGTTEEQMAHVVVKNRNNGRKNKNALTYNEKKVGLEDVLSSKKISDPIKKLDCSQVCEGASAILLTSSRRIKEFTDNPVWIKGIGHQTSCASFGNIVDEILTSSPAKQASNLAFKMAGIGPSNIDVAEIHDAFSILEIMAYEDLGFVKRGFGGKYAEKNLITINPRGGLIGMGHPLGTTGISQAVEIFSQLSNIDKKRKQRNYQKTGIIHNLAAAGTSASVIILGVD